MQLKVINILALVLGTINFLGMAAHNLSEVVFVHLYILDHYNAYTTRSVQLNKTKSAKNESRRSERRYPSVRSY